MDDEEERQKGRAKQAGEMGTKRNYRGGRERSEALPSGNSKHKTKVKKIQCRSKVKCLFLKGRRATESPAAELHQGVWRSPLTEALLNRGPLLRLRCCFVPDLQALRIPPPLLLCSLLCCHTSRTLHEKNTTAAPAHGRHSMSEGLKPSGPESHTSDARSTCQLHGCRTHRQLFTTSSSSSSFFSPSPFPKLTLSHGLLLPLLLLLLVLLLLV
ncbi:unnamed protein product [Pleuronectes platessa]|uniref:Uncharacterized protein n=1 Tax=Pleuronectes platessa TaxID=8262 RepID=A0A9N7VUQ5_PLEPL|nr:unnamed protein product [Pleuronectes platessa]